MGTSSTRRVVDRPSALRVAFAYDDPDARRALRRIVELWAADVVDTGTGQGLLLLLAHRGPFDLVVCAQGLPLLSGAEILRRRRAVGDETPFVILNDTGESAITAGFSHSVSIRQPFAVESLKAAARAALGAVALDLVEPTEAALARRRMPRGSGDPVVALPVAVVPRSIHAVVADRDPILRRVVATKLRIMGATVDEVADEPPLERALESAPPLDLIVAEVEMLGRNLIPAIYRAAKATTTRFVLMADHADALVLRALRLPNAIVIEKPFGMTELYGDVTAVLNLGRSAAGAVSVR